MKRKMLLLAISWVFLWTGAKAQQAEQFFQDMPEELLPMLPMLPMSLRGDLVYLYDEMGKATISDVLEGDITITEKEENYIRLEMEGKTLEIVVLERSISGGENNIPIILCIETVCGPLCDSYLSFYNAQWEPLNDLSLYIEPVPLDYFIEKNENDPALEIEFMTFTYDYKENRLIQRQHATEYLSREDKERIKPYVRRSERVFLWSGDRFE
jgi:Protein of unknown function (DUF3256).